MLRTAHVKSGKDTLVKYDLCTCYMLYFFFSTIQKVLVVKDE